MARKRLCGCGGGVDVGVEVSCVVIRVCSVRGCRECGRASGVHAVGYRRRAAREARRLGESKGKGREGDGARVREHSGLGRGEGEGARAGKGVGRGGGVGEARLGVGVGEMG